VGYTNGDDITEGWGWRGDYFENTFSYETAFSLKNIKYFYADETQDARMILIKFYTEILIMKTN
jgi:hypothetical protein